MSWIDEKISKEEREKKENEETRKQNIIDENNKRIELEKRRKINWEKISPYEKKIQELAQDVNQQLSPLGYKIDVHRDIASLVFRSSKKITNDSFTRNFYLSVENNRFELSYYENNGSFIQGKRLHNINMNNFNKDNLITMMGAISQNKKLRYKVKKDSSPHILDEDIFYLSLDFPNLAPITIYLKEWLVFHIGTIGAIFFLGTILILIINYLIVK